MRVKQWLLLCLVPLAGLTLHYSNTQAVTPNDQDFNQQWYLYDTAHICLKAPGAWDIYHGRVSDKVAIFDEGAVDATHPELQGHVVVVNGTIDGAISARATQVAGFIAAKGNDWVGMAGLLWSGTIGSRAFQIESPPLLNDASIWCQANGYSIICMPWTYADTNSVGLRTTYKTIYRRNQLTVLAMPEASSIYEVPAAYDLPGAIAVNPINTIRQLPGYAVRRPYVTLAAPGSDAVGGGIWTTTLGGGYGLLRGTAAASGLVAGAAALVMGYADQQGITLANDDVVQLLTMSAQKVDGVDWDDKFGYGVVDAEAALALLQAPNRLVQKVAVGGADTEGSPVQGILYGDNPFGLASGVYQYIPHTIEQDVSFGITFTNPPKVWARGPFCTGSTAGVLSWRPYAEVVPGSVTTTGCRLRTYVYDVYDAAGAHKGFYPSEPANVQMACSVLGVPVPPPLVVSIGGPTSVSCMAGATWVGSVSGGVGNYTFAWKEQPDLGELSGVLSTTQEYTRSQMAGTNLTILFTVTSGAQTRTATLYVGRTCGGGGGGDGCTGADDPNCPLYDLAIPYRPHQKQVVDLAIAWQTPMRIGLYDVNGRLVRSIYDGLLASGRHRIEWHSDGLSSGMYFVRVAYEGKAVAKRALILGE